jgi:hypothetical protein
MGSKTKTTTDNTSANTYAPGALNGYATAQKQAQGFVNNPYGNPFYQQTYTQGMNNANQINQNQQSNLIQNMQRSGMADGSPASIMLRQMGGYQASHNQAGAFLNASNQAQSMFGSGMNFLSNPLVTGGTGSSSGSSHGEQVQSTSGLGTWLPQVVGAGIGAATGFAGGGGFMGALKGIGGGMGSGGGGGNAMGGYMGALQNVPNASGYSPSSFGGYMGGAGNISGYFGGPSQVPYGQ